MVEAKKALLVDDSVQTTTLISEILFEAGYEVKVALNGKEGLINLYDKKNFFDLVIAEINIPGTQGEDFIKMTRNEPRHKNIPIIAMSNKFEKSRLEECIKAGVTDLLLKPFEPADIIKVIKLFPPFSPIT